MTTKPYWFNSLLSLPHTDELSIPAIHLGVYLMSGREASQAVGHALRYGYIAIDSAQMYHNEGQCGKAIKDFLASTDNKDGLKREDIFFTSKLASNSTDYDTVRASIKQSIKACGLGYLDLFLLHSPYGGKEARLTSWRAVEDAVSDGEIRIGGVSNFGIKHLEELKAAKPRTLPAVNQIEVHPFNTRTKLTEYCMTNGIMVEAYAPLARALRMKHPVIQELSSKYKCTPAQLMVKWSVQHNFVPLPKSVTPSRIEENVQIDHIQIESTDMKRMDDLDEYLVTDWDPVDAP